MWTFILMSGIYMIVLNSLICCCKNKNKNQLNLAYIGPSGVRALPLAAGINVGGHYFRYFFHLLFSYRRC